MLLAFSSMAYIQPPENDPASHGAQRRGAADSPRALEGMTVGRLFGVEIGVDWSLWIIFALIAFNLSAVVFPSWHPSWSGGLAWAVGLGAAVAFFASVLVHELSHALVARVHGIPVRRITLFLFGGVAHMQREPGSPKAEFWIAIVGPLTSLAIGLSALTLGVNLAGENLQAAAELGQPEAVGAAIERLGPMSTLLIWLGPINVMLALFNVIPGFPMDGGRVLRSAIWAITGDLLKATRWAAGVGQAFALVLIGWGMLQMLSGAFGAGLWMVLIGWFLGNAAKLSHRQLVVRQALESVPVERLMRKRVASVPPDLPLEAFVRDHLIGSDQQAFPVESEGHLLGLVRFSDVRKLPHAAWRDASVRDVMTPIEQLSSLSPDAGAERALEEMVEHDVDQLPVIERERVVGMVGRGDLMKWLTLRGAGRDHIPAPSR